jgi:hypothetical protein
MAGSLDATTATWSLPSERGACHDGLTPSGLNGNQGAESSLMWLIALERIRQLRRTSDAHTCDAVPVHVPL